MTSKNLIVPILLCLAALSCAPASAQIPRTYTVECGLKDGSKFLLTVPYKYYPLSRGHATTHQVDGDWTVHYVTRTGRKSRAPAYIPFSDPASADCSQVGKIGGVPVANQTYLMANGKWSARALIPDKLDMSPTFSEQPAPLRKRLEELDASPNGDFAIVVPRNKRLVYEMALNRFGDKFPDGKVVAVHKSISVDNGRTWSDPVITTTAEIYELGKSEKEQSFAGHPRKQPET